MPVSPAQPPAANPEAKALPAERKPWHAPTLTQVELKVTGQASGTPSDKTASTTPNPG